MVVLYTPRGRAGERLPCVSAALHGQNERDRSPAVPIGTPPRTLRMPSLYRFLTVVAILVGIGYAALYALANFVTPTPREMTATVPPDKFLKK